VQATGRQPLPSIDRRGLTDNLRRGSNGSSGTKSAHSGIYDNSSASARFSSSSTLPSSADEELFGSKNHPDGHALSYRGSMPVTARNQKPLPPNPTRYYSTHGDELFNAPTPSHRRDRSLTTISSTSTAMPPKLDSGLSLDFSTGFDNIFDGLDKSDGDDAALQKPSVPGSIIRSVRSTFVLAPIFQNRTNFSPHPRTPNLFLQFHQRPLLLPESHKRQSPSASIGPAR
jgi:hypothetical protein